jgi:hypothetical protein
MRRMRSPCCARAASGHAAAPPSSCQFRYAAKFVDEQEIPQDDPSSDPGGMETLERGLEIDRIAFGPLPARAGLQDIELARISQRASE